MMLKINLDVHRSGYKQYKFSFVQSVFKQSLNVTLNKQQEFETSQEQIN